MAQETVGMVQETMDMMYLQGIAPPTVRCETVSARAQQMERWCDGAEELLMRGEILLDERERRKFYWFQGAIRAKVKKITL